MLAYDFIFHRMLFGK